MITTCPEGDFNLPEFKCDGDIRRSITYQGNAEYRGCIGRDINGAPLHEFHLTNGSILNVVAKEESIEGLNEGDFITIKYTI